MQVLAGMPSEDPHGTSTGSHGQPPLQHLVPYPQWPHNASPAGSHEAAHAGPMWGPHAIVGWNSTHFMTFLVISALKHSTSNDRKLVIFKMASSRYAKTGISHSLFPLVWQFWCLPLGFKGSGSLISNWITNKSKMAAKQLHGYSAFTNYPRVLAILDLVSILGLLLSLVSSG